MPAKLSTTLKRVNQLQNQENVILINQFHEFMKENGASERHQNNNSKIVLSFAGFIDSKSLEKIDTKDYILQFLQQKITDKDLDTDQKWITTYNDNLYFRESKFRNDNYFIHILLETDVNLIT
jgi:hypothetical protein